jgi:tetratricopeptide (TPR) repeat protein/TolB-like protein
MPASGLWSRVREARLLRVLAVYLGVSWLILQVTSLFIQAFDLPKWFLPAAVLLLLIGLVVISATAWVQAHPGEAARAAREEVPGSWEIDLGDIRQSVTQGRLPHLTWGRSILGGAVAFSLLFGVAGLYVLLHDRGRSLGPETVQAAPGTALAVLPFRVVGPEMELWREGMVDLLSTNLDGAAGMRAVAPRTVLSRWHEELGETAEPADSQALRVARDVGARYALLGGMVALGGEVRLSAQVFDLRSGKLQAETQVKGAPDSIPALVDRLSLEVMRAALPHESGALGGVDLRSVSTSSLPALKAYLSGEQAFRGSRWEDAKVDFTRAVDADSTFALALYRLSLTYGWLDPTSPQIEEYGKRALRFADRLPERGALLLRGGAASGREAFAILDSLTTRYPDDADGWYELGEAYVHRGRQFLFPDERYRQAFHKAIELDPSFGSAYIHLIGDAFQRADSAEARGLIARYAKIEPTSPETLGSELSLALTWGDAETRKEAVAALDTAGRAELSRVWLDLLSAGDFWQEILTVSRAMQAERLPLDLRQRGALNAASVLTARGRMKEAREALLTAPAVDLVRASRDILTWSLVGMVDRSSAESAVTTLASEPSPLRRLLLGAHALAAGNQAEVGRQLGALDSLAPLGLKRFETGEWVDPRAAAEALRAYVEDGKGDRSGAIRRLEAALAGIGGGCPGDGCAVHALLRFQLGRWLLENGDAARAEPYFKSLDDRASYFFLPTALYLGKTYEELGNLAEARRQYELFVRDWQDCDPELRPLLDDARQSIARLKEVKKL